MTCWHLCPPHQQLFHEHCKLWTCDQSVCWCTKCLSSPCISCLLMLTCVAISIISLLSYVSLAKLVKHTAPMPVLTSWHCLSQRQEVIQRKEEAAKQAAWGEAGVIIEDLKAALAGAQQQLRKERAARDQLEEDMKQSFMRSVCAINLEVRLLPTTEICVELGDAKLRASLHALDT